MPPSDIIFDLNLKNKEYLYSIPYTTDLGSNFTDFAIFTDSTEILPPQTL